MPNKKKLYEALKAEGYDNFADESSFNAYVDNADNRKKLFSALKQEGYDNFADETEFEKYLGYNSEDNAAFEANAERFRSGQPIDRVTTQSVIDANPELGLQQPVVDQTQQYIMNNKPAIFGEKKKSLMDIPLNVSPDVVEGSQNLEKLSERARIAEHNIKDPFVQKARTEADLRGLSSEIDGLLEKSVQEERASVGGSAFMPAGARGRAYTEANKDRVKEVTDLSSAKRLLDQSQYIIDAAKRGDTGILKDTWQGFKDSLEAEDFTFGLADAASSASILDAIKKVENGEELTEAEDKLLRASAINMATQYYYANDLNRAYKAGQVSAESVPFMLEMAINPISSLGKASAKTLLNYGLKSYAKQVGKGLAKGAAAGTGMALTTGLGRVAAGTTDRLAEGYNYGVDFDGNLYAEKKEDAMGVGEAVARSLASTAIENQSEMIFNAFKGFGGFMKGVQDVLPGGVNKFFDMLSHNKVADAYRYIKNSPVFRNYLVKDIRNATQIGGLGEEYLEEVYNNLANAAIGEMKWEDVVSLDKNIDTLLGLAPTQVMFGLLGLGGAGAMRYQTRKTLEDLQATMNEQQRKDLEGLLDMGLDAKEVDVRGFIRNVMQNENYNIENKRDLIKAAYNVAKQNGIDELTEADTIDKVNAENSLIDSVTDPSTGIYTEITATLPDAKEGTIEVPGYVVGWLGEGEKRQPIFVQEGMDNTYENRRVLKPGQWSEEAVQQMPVEEVKAISEEMIREEAAQQAEQEAKYAPEVLNAQMQQGVPFDTPNAQIVPVAPMPEGNGWIVEEYALDTNNKVAKTPIVRELTNNEYRDMLQAQLNAEEAAQKQLEEQATAPEVVEEVQPTEEAVVKENFTTETGNNLSPVEEVAQPQAEVNPQTPVIPTKEDGSIDFVSYGKEGTFKTLGEKYGEKMPNKVAVTAKALAEDLKKAQNKLQKAEEAYDNAPIGREQKAEEARDKAKQELEAIQREANFWAEMDAEIKDAQARRESMLNPQAEAETSTEPMNVDEFVAQQLASGNIVLDKEDYKKETGYGDTEANAMNGGATKLFGKNGMTIQEAGERLMEIDRENGTNFFDQLDSNSGRDALINVLGSVKSRKELNQYIATNRAEQAKRESEGLRNELEKQSMEANYASLEDYVLQMEVEEMENPFLNDRADEIMAIFAEEAAKYEQSLNNTKNGQGTENEVVEGNDSILPKEQLDNTGRTEVSEESERIGNGTLQQNEEAHTGEEGKNERVGRKRPKGFGKPKKSTEELFSDEKDKFSNAVNNDYAEVISKSNSVEEAITEFKRRAEEARKRANEWRNRKYKENKTVVTGMNPYSGADLYETTIGAANERRREANVRNALAEAEKYESYASTLAERTNYIQVKGLQQQEGETILQFAERAAEENRRRPLRKRAEEWSNTLGVKVTYLESIDDVDAKTRREIEAAHAKGSSVPGWVNKKGEVFFFMPDLSDLKDVDDTYIHEVVAHVGLPQLLGKERFGELCDKVWEMMPQSAKDYYYNYPGVNNTDDSTKEGKIERQRRAADEYIAHLAEQQNLTPEERTIWDNIVKMFREMLDKALNGIISKSKLTDEDISNLIKASYANLKSGAEGVSGEGTRFSVKLSKEEQAIIDKSKADGTYMKAPNGEPTNLTEKQWVQVRTKAFKTWFGDWEKNPKKSSLMIDENGEPKVFYHGSPSRFNEFISDKMGETGTGYGQGFYFSPEKWFAEGYVGENGGTIYEVFLNLRKPISDTKKTLKKPSIKRFIDEIDKRMMERDDDGIGILDNWNDVSYYGRNKVLNEATEAVFEYNETDLEIVGDLINTSGSYDIVTEVLRDVLGFDGILPSNTDNEVIVHHPNQIKSATDNVGTFNSSNNDIRFRFIGERGARNLDKAEEATTRLDNLAVAREMEGAEKDAKTIKMATGWERGADGLWRYETMDSETAIKDGDEVEIRKQIEDIEEEEKAYKKKAREEGIGPDEREEAYINFYRRRGFLEAQLAYVLAKNADVLTHISTSLYHVLDKTDSDSLFKAYPELEFVKVGFATELVGKSLGATVINGSRIEAINLDVKRSTPEELNGYLAHEIQHAIQEIEGFAPGGAPSMESPRKAEQKAKNISFMKDKLDKSVSERNSLLKQRNEINDKMSAWWDAHEDATREDMLADKVMQQYNSEYDELSKQIDEADNTVKFNEKWLDATLQANTALGYEGYKKLAGEVEARNVTSRLGMTLEQRRNSLASETEDVAREDQIFLKDGIESGMRFRLSEKVKQIQAEADKFTSKYNSKPVRIVEAEMDDNELMEALDNAFELEDVKSFMKESKTAAGYFHNLDKIIIFADKTKVERMEEYLFHENIHAAIHHNNFANLVAHFYEYAKNEAVFEKWSKLAHNKEYKQYNSSEEFLAYVVSNAMVARNLDEVAEYLGDKQKKALNKLFNVIGYDYDIRRRSNEQSVNRRTSEETSGESSLEGNELLNTGEGRGTGERIGKGKSRKVSAAERKARLTELFNKVADMGLQGVLGNKEYTSLMVDIYKALPEGVRAEIAEDALRLYGGSVAPAVSDYIGPKSKNSIMDKVVTIVREALRKVGFDLDLNANEVRYMAWRSKKPLDRNNMFEVAEDIDMKYRLKVGEYDGTTPDGGGTRFRVTKDSNGNELSEGQKSFFAKSQAVDENGNLLVLYHGTSRAGFAEFKSGWFTTSKKDAISYSGDRKGRIFDPSEALDQRLMKAGDFRLGYMTFDSEEDKNEFLLKHPTADTAMTERELESKLSEFEFEDDYESFDALEARKPELKKIWEDYRNYEFDHLVDKTIADLLASHDSYTENDLRRAIYKVDSNAYLDDINEIEDVNDRKEALVDALNDFNETSIEDGSNGIMDIVVPVRVPRNGEGYKHNDSAARTYEVYVNALNPLIIYGKGKHSELESGDIYSQIYKGLEDDSYDSVIVRNWRVGRYQELGDVVVPKSSNQIKLTSNYSPSESKDIRFRVANKLQVRDEYEATIKKGGYQAREAVQDAMLSLRKFQELIEKASGKKIRDFENAWMHENRLSSVVQAEIHDMERKFYKPMMDAVKKLMYAANLEQEQVADYLMLKHGIERNREMAVRKALTDDKGKIDRTRLEQWYQEKDAIRNDATLDTWRKKQEAMDNAALNYGADMSRDYSGLTSMFGTDDLADSTQKAYDEVEALETAHPVETESLGKAVKAMTQNTLDKSFESGLMDRKVYDELSKDMYDYYIPLRGFEETTSEEVYAYLDQDRGAFNAPLKRAKGRSSKSDNPIAYLKSIAESGIMQGNRNKMKQSFLNMVINNPSDLVSVREGVWVIYNPASGEWEAASAPAIPNNATQADVEAAMEAWEQQMEQAAQNDPNIKKVSEAADVPYRVVGNRMDQHQIIVKRLGKSYTLTINGNPRLAMAINGQTNPNNTSNDGKVAAFVNNKIGALNRSLAAWYTTRNPDFVASNFMRDTFYTNTIVRAKEGNAYANKFHRNYATVLPKMLELFRKYENGTLNPADQTDASFLDFMMNGGETGYSNLKDLEHIKKQISKELKGNRFAKVEALAEKLDILNRAVENTARFAAFLTSREEGRSIAKSVFDAKEISVNFNKKGAGGTFFGMTGQTWFGNLASMVGASGRALYVFFNAAIQGTTNLMHVMKVNPKGTSAGLAAMFLMGAVIPFLFDDDDENDYYDLPEHVRRNHLIIPGTNDAWISIPLPIEYRIMYGMGELLTSWRTGHERGFDIGRKMLNLTGQALPLNFLEEGFDAFIPSALSPVWQVYNNRSWTGLPIYKDNEFNKDDPEYTKAYKNVDKLLYNFSKSMYEWTFDEENQKEGIDLNPAVIESLARGYFGGLATQLSNIGKTAEIVAGERDFDWRSIPIGNRLFKSGDERTKEKRVTNEYFENMEKLDFLQSRERMLKKTEKGVAVPESDKFKAQKDLETMQGTEVYKKYQEFKKQKKVVDKIRKTIKEKGSTPEREKQLIEAQEAANKSVR